MPLQRGNPSTVIGNNMTKRDQKKVPKNKKKNEQRKPGGVNKKMNIKYMTQGARDAV